MANEHPLSEASAEAVRRFSDFLGSTVGELLRDQARWLQWRNAHTILDKAQRLHQQRRAPGKQTLPLGLAIRFMDGASMEDDPTIQDLWACLLSNAADPDHEYEISKTHIALLREMNALDARVLRQIDAGNWIQVGGVADATGQNRLDCAEIATQLGEFEDEVALALGNLWRLGCLIQDPTWTSGSGPSIAPNSSFRLSPLGGSLLFAVEFPAEPEGSDKG